MFGYSINNHIIIDRYNVHRNFLDFVIKKIEKEKGLCKLKKNLKIHIVKIAAFNRGEYVTDLNSKDGNNWNK